MKFDARAVYELETLNKVSDEMLSFLGERLKKLKEDNLLTDNELETCKDRMMTETINRLDAMDEFIL